jgi:hypothetical protein
VASPANGAFGLQRANHSNLTGYLWQFGFDLQPRSAAPRVSVLLYNALLQPHSTGSLHALLRALKPRWLSSESTTSS